MNKPVIAILALLLATAAWPRDPAAAPEFGQASKDSVWVTTPERMIRRMLQYAVTHMPS